MSDMADSGGDDGTVGYMLDADQKAGSAPINRQDRKPDRDPFRDQLIVFMSLSKNAEKIIGCIIQENTQLTGDIDIPFYVQARRKTTGTDTNSWMGNKAGLSNYN
jgi:hypothetical protein